MWLPARRIRFLAGRHCTGCPGQMLYFWLTRVLCGSLHDSQLAQGPVTRMPCSMCEILPCLAASNLHPQVFLRRFALLRRKCGSALFDHPHPHPRSVGEVKGAMRCLPASDLLLLDAQDPHARLPPASLQCFSVPVLGARRVGSLAAIILQPRILCKAHAGRTCVAAYPAWQVRSFACRPMSAIMRSVNPAHC